MRIFHNKTILITAGPTHEPIDPVRYIGNKSSGKMGFALAEELAERGAIVHLVSGPVNLKAHHKNIKVIHVTTAAEMYEACHLNFKKSNVAILAAAVADYSIKNPSKIKLKKQEGNLTLELKRTKDILKSLGQIKNEQQVLVGFALETNDEEQNATKKLKSKNLDFIVLNSLQDKGAGFQHDTNKITILDKNNKKQGFELKTKREVAKDIVDYLAKMM